MWRNRKEQLEITFKDFKEMWAEMKGTIMATEHGSIRVGEIMKPWYSEPDIGIDWEFDDSEIGRTAEFFVSSGLMTGLSLKHRANPHGTGKCKPYEVSICIKGARDHTGVLPAGCSYEPMQWEQTAVAASGTSMNSGEYKQEEDVLEILIEACEVLQVSDSMETDEGPTEVPAAMTGIPIAQVARGLSAATTNPLNGGQLLDSITGNGKQPAATTTTTTTTKAPAPAATPAPAQNDTATPSMTNKEESALPQQPSDTKPDKLLKWQLKKMEEKEGTENAKARIAKMSVADCCEALSKHILPFRELVSDRLADLQLANADGVKASADLEALKAYLIETAIKANKYANPNFDENAMRKKLTQMKPSDLQCAASAAQEEEAKHRASQAAEAAEQAERQKKWDMLRTHEQGMTTKALERSNTTNTTEASAPASAPMQTSKSTVVSASFENGFNGHVAKKEDFKGDAIIVAASTGAWDPRDPNIVAASYYADHYRGAFGGNNFMNQPIPSEPDNGAPVVLASAGSSGWGAKDVDASVRPQLGNSQPRLIKQLEERPSRFVCIKSKFDKAWDLTCTVKAAAFLTGVCSDAFASSTTDKIYPPSVNKRVKNSGHLGRFEQFNSEVAASGATPWVGEV